MASAEGGVRQPTVSGWEDDRFDGMWDSLALEGHADGRGGSQYRRALWAWRDAGMPRSLRWLAVWLDADDLVGGGGGGEGVADAE